MPFAPPAVHPADAPFEAIEADIWTWMRDFVALKNEFYGGRFPPCPYAQGALLGKTVDVSAWRTGDVRGFIRQRAADMCNAPSLTTRVLALPPRTQLAWGIGGFVESLNAELIPQNVFLNTGVAKTTTSRYPGSRGQPYFIVVANSLDAVLKGASALRKTGYYADWPKTQMEIVVERRERMARRYGAAREADHL